MFLVFLIPFLFILFLRSRNNSRQPSGHMVTSQTQRGAEYRRPERFFKNDLFPQDLADSSGVRQTTIQKQGANCGKGSILQIHILEHTPNRARPQAKSQMFFPFHQGPRCSLEEFVNRAFPPGFDNPQRIDKKVTITIAFKKVQRLPPRNVCQIPKTRTVILQIQGTLPECDSI